MIARLVAFEFRQRLKLMSSYVYAIVLFAAGAFLMLGSGGAFRSIAVSVGSERVYANSPYSLFQTTATVALFGLFTVAAVFGQAAYRDFGENTWMLIFSKNVRPSQYLIGRFLGAFAFSAVLFLTIGLGQLLASAVVYFVKPSRLGATQPLAYLWPYVVQVWPMLFFTGAVFFTLAALTRKMATVYVGVVILVLGYLIAGVLIQDVDDWTVAALVDPFGFSAFELAVRYWTPADRNRDLVSVAGLVGLNRALWCGAGAALLLLTLHRFRPVPDELGRARRPAELESPPAVRTAAAATRAGRATAARGRGFGRAMLSAAALHLREVLRSGIYWALVLSGLSFLLFIFGVSKQFYGTPTLPVTYQVLELSVGAFNLFSLITITLYAGELVHRERDAGVQDLVDATPAPTWVMFWSKVLALWGVAATLVVMLALAALVGQLARGFTRIEGGLYLVHLGVITWTRYALIGVLALTLQILCNHKYVGHFAMVCYFMSSWLLGLLGIEDRLIDYAEAPDVHYSDMNGYGSMLERWGWFRAYWSAFAVLLLALGACFFQRGREQGVRARILAARQRFTRPWQVLTLVAAGAFVAIGGFIFYNTHVLNPYVTQKRAQEYRALYEKRYRSWHRREQPKVVDVQVAFDIQPEAPSLRASGRYRLQNDGARAINRVLVLLPYDIELERLTIAGADRPEQWDRPLGVRIYRLPKPLPPGAQAELEFSVLLAARGFAHGQPRHDVVGNGTFLNNGNLPYLGYDASRELTRDEDRADYGLAPKQRMASRDDRVAAEENYLRQDADFIGFRADVTTAADQLAIAPGYLQHSEVANGRRRAQYAMDHPILHFFSVLSARYAVKRDRWNDVALEIYHHPSHTWNLDRMMRGMKDALEYCSTAFGPYQHRQARILEFPRYETFAQAFPNTIPYSEAVGFIARVRDSEPDDINFPYYITAHEIAHQWWAHQVIGANVRGATVITESLAQYSALMVMKRAYHPNEMRRFLKFELDGYLSGRATEQERELPLAHNENQPYIHYRKGSLVMYALQDFIGEDRVNRALRRYLEAAKFKGPPYTTAADLVQELRAETPAEYAYLIDDLFETITLYDNRSEEATLKPAAGGGWDVRLRVVVRKFRSDEHGEQTELDVADYIDVGALDHQGNALGLERRKLGKGPAELTFHVPSSEPPAKVGIDPLNKLIDRQSDDNVVVPELVP